MRLSVKIAFGCAIGAVLVILLGFIAFPKLLKNKVTSMKNLDKDSDFRKLFVKIPFGLDFKVYMFNVTNPMDVQNGALPVLKEVGPFCFEEWKEKVDIEDVDDEDVMFYKPKDTFYRVFKPGCLSGDEIITIPHPLILGMVNAVVRTQPGMLSLVGKAIDSIYNKPDSIFLTARAMDILFDGVTIHCGVKDFAAIAVCGELKKVPDLRVLNKDDLAFSLLSKKNATVGKKFKILRGVKDYRDTGRILEYDDQKAMKVWPTDECNHLKGTDGTILPPYISKEHGIVSFAPGICRSLGAVYSKDEEYAGLSVEVYTATLGDMSNNPREKCYCSAPDKCLKKGMMDLFKCVGVPIYVSLPHFYESDESYLKGVIGLNPNKEQHGLALYLEPMTGSPVKAANRLQFNMPLEPNDKIPIFNNLTNTVLPMFWIEEAIALNGTFTAPLKNIFNVIKVVQVIKWSTLLGCLGGLGAAGYLYFSKKDTVYDIKSVHKVKAAENNGVSSDLGGQVNHGMTDIDKEKD